MSNNINEKINKGVEEIKKISMTADEKNRMLENIMNSPISPYKPTPSHFGFGYAVSIFQNKTIFQYVTTSCLVLILAGGSVGFAASGTLPGNTLYSVKIKVIEPLNSFLKFSPEAKAKYESSLATERLIEAEALAAEGNLDADKEEVLSNLLEHHTDALNNYRGKFNINDKSAKEDDDIVLGFENKVNEHTKTLDRIRNKENETVEMETKINKTAKASVEKVKEAKNNNKNKQN